VVETEVAGLQGTYLVTATDLAQMGQDSDQKYRLTFLPNLDPCIMGYKDRSRFLHPSKYDRVFDPSGNALPTVWCDGKVVGIWMEDKKLQAIEVLLFDPVAGHLREQMEAEARRLSCFLEYSAPNIEIKPYPPEVYAKTPFSLGERT
jgi:hypothetical protein